MEERIDSDDKKPERTQGQQASSPLGPEEPLEASRDTIEDDAPPIEMSADEAIGLHAESSDVWDWPARLVGTMVAGRYHITDKIAEGGTAIVYRAMRQPHEDPVVLKVARSLVSDAEVAAFEAAAARLRLLEHPNIVAVHDVGVDNGLGYIAMEPIIGCSLREIIERDGPMDVQRFRRVADQLLDGLGEAHDHGIVHRDITPANVLLTPLSGRRDHVKIIDFQLASPVDEDGAEITQKAIVGTFAFMAPEQVDGEAADTRSDVYALGVLFYYLLSGKLPFSGETMAVLYKHVHEPPPPLTDQLPADHKIPASLVALIHACLAKEPEIRPGDASELRELLRDCLRADGALAAARPPAHRPPPATTSQQPSKPAPRQVVAASSEPTPVPEPVVNEPSRRSKLTFVASTLGLITAGILLFVWLVGEPVDMAVRTARAAAGAVGAGAQGEQELSGLLDQAEARIDAGKFGQAETLIERIQDALAGKPDLLVRAVALEDRLLVERQFATGLQHEELGDVDGAIDAYKAVLHRDSGHAGAMERLDALAGDVPPLEERTSVLSIDVDPDGIVFIDDRLVGHTPVERNLLPGVHEIEIRVKGHATIRRSIHLDDGESRRLYLDPTDERTKTQAVPEKESQGHDGDRDDEHQSDDSNDGPRYEEIGPTPQPDIPFEDYYRLTLAPTRLDGRG